MCDCKRFNNKQKSSHSGATHEMTCIDCECGKLYFIGKIPYKVTQNN